MVGENYQQNHTQNAYSIGSDNYTYSETQLISPNQYLAPTTATSSNMDNRYELSQLPQMGMLTRELYDYILQLFNKNTTQQTNSTSTSAVNATGTSHALIAYQQQENRDSCNGLVSSENPKE